MLYYEVRCDYLSVYSNDALRCFCVHDTMLPICELYYVTITFLYSEKRYSVGSMGLYYDWLIVWLIDLCFTPYRQYSSHVTAATIQ